MNHLREAEFLARECLEQVIDSRSTRVDDETPEVAQ